VTLRLRQFLHPECFIPDLPDTTREEALGQILRLLAQEKLISREKPILARLLARERLMTTAVGNRIAIPRCFADEVPGLVITVARSRGKIDFHSYDGLPTQAVILFLGKTGDDWTHFIALARFAHLIRETPFVDRLISSVCVEDMVKAFDCEEQIAW
jgi:mannitol/fructose-specific phosphotransferase system IIA component (Ntr-type)